MRSPGSICSARLRRFSMIPITRKPRPRVASKLSGEPVRIQVAIRWKRNAGRVMLDQSKEDLQMAVEPDPDLITPDEIAYRLELTPAQLKITHAALKSYLDDFGHDERDVHRVVHEVLDKLPDEHSIRAIDLRRELEAE